KHNLVAYGDRSVYRLPDGQSQWLAAQGNLQITQFYNLTLDPNNADKAYGIAQDHGRLLQFNGNKVWSYGSAGGETGKVLVSPADSKVLFVSDPLGDGPNWDYVQRSTDGGQNWTTILTSNQISAGADQDYDRAYTIQRSFDLDPNNPSHLFLGVSKTSAAGGPTHQYQVW